MKIKQKKQQKSFSIFIAGVMQGTKKGHGIRSQDYRKILTQGLQKIHANVQIVDPDVDHPNRLSYSFDEAKSMFMHYTEVAGKVDILIAYIPEASMGSAVEMWSAYAQGVPILTVSPMEKNWVVKLLSRKVFKSIEELLAYASTEEFRSLTIWKTA